MNDSSGSGFSEASKYLLRLDQKSPMIKPFFARGVLAEAFLVDQNSDKHAIDITATAAALGTLFFWSLGPIFIKYLAGYLDSWTQNLLRYSVACVFWLPYLLYCHKTDRLDQSVWKRAIPPAVANTTMQSFWAAGLYYAGPAFMVLLTKMNIIWIAGFSMILFREERSLIKSWQFWLGLALCLLGVFGVLYFKVDITQGRTLVGVVLGLITAFMWGLYMVSARAAFRNIDSAAGFSVVTIYTVIGLCILGFAFGNVGKSLQMGARQWGAVVISSITAIALAHALYYASMRRIGATIPALIVLVQPFTVLAISHFAFDESMNLLQILSGIILLLGAGLAIWAQQHLGQDTDSS